MAATAYASLVSLMNVLIRYQHPTCPVSFDQSKIQTLLDKVSSLVEFLEMFDYSRTKTSTCSIQDLERKITRAAYAVEDTIESYYVLDRDSGCLTPPCDIILQSDIEKAICAMDQIIRESDQVGVKKHKTHHSTLSLTNQRPNYAPPMSAQQEIVTRLYEIGNTNTSEQLSQLSRLMNQIRVHSLKCEIIPIVGMGGIGKTTLTTNAFNSQYACRHFDIRAWVKISQYHDVNNVIASLLQDIEVKGNDQMEDGDKLYKGLCGKRYLVVLDDIWSIQAWEEIRRFFPDNINGSRILLTTRDHSIARRFGLASIYEVEFLDDDESFNLLSETVYGVEVFPRELEILGKKIAKGCKGLPLAVVVTGGLLKTRSKTLEYWKEISENLSSVIGKEDESGKCLEILYLSYSHLPIHLRPCFLHMATCEEGDKTNVSKLINLWIAEGFLKPTKKNSNDVALEYLTDLIDRNLIIVAGRGRTRKIEKVSMHDLLRELCLRESQNENFVCIVDEDTPNLQQRLECERRIVYRHSRYGSIALLPPMPYARSLTVIGFWSCSVQLASICGLLRVMNLGMGSELQMDFAGLVNIRYLEVQANGDVEAWLTCSFPLIWNLESLTLSIPYLPSEIWGFPYLRYLDFCYTIANIPGPTDGSSKCVLNSLQTINKVSDLYCSDEVFRLIPNLKELCVCYTKLIDYDKLANSFSNLALLPKLEKLSVEFSILNKVTMRLSFSPTLVVLILFSSRIPWDDMTNIGCLPNLQLLDLSLEAFYGDEWNPNDGEFQCLKYLCISNCPIITWNAESCHFPRLEHLILGGLKLENIPLGIGEITSLELIELYAGSNISVVASLFEILEERTTNQGEDDDLRFAGTYAGEWSEELAKMKDLADAHKQCQFDFSFRNAPVDKNYTRDSFWSNLCSDI